MTTQTETSSSHTMSANPRIHLNRSSSHSRSQKKPWQSRRAPSFRSHRSAAGTDPETERLSREISRQTTSSTKPKPKWWKVRLFRGMIDDVKRRLPYYWSDWRDAWDYRVIPATVYMYFAKYDRSLALVSFLQFLIPLPCSFNSEHMNPRTWCLKCVVIWLPLLRSHLIREALSDFLVFVS